MIKLGDLNEKVPTGEGVKIPGRGISSRGMGACHSLSHSEICGKFSMLGIQFCFFFQNDNTKYFRNLSEN